MLFSGHLNKLRVHKISALQFILGGQKAEKYIHKLHLDICRMKENFKTRIVAFINLVFCMQLVEFRHETETVITLLQRNN